VVVGATQLYRNGFLNGEIKQGLDEEAELKLINDFKAEFRINYPLVVCVKGSSMFNYGVLSIPTVVLVDRAGNVRSIDVNTPAEVLDKRLSSLLAEKAGS
jgi:hypothetical protein